METHFWTRFSKKIGAKIENPRSVGRFTLEDALARGMRLVVGRGGEIVEGNAVTLYCLVDESDGVFVDVKFQMFGPSSLIAAAESVCEILIGKNYDQIKRVGVELIDKQLRDRPDEIAFPQEAATQLNIVMLAVDDAVSVCSDIPLSQGYVSPLPRDFEGKEEGGYPDWLKLNEAEKIACIEEVLNTEIRPYVELDQGGIEIQKLVDGRELYISYQGACTSCYSAIGTTLTAIQEIMRAKVHPEITVIPNMEDLQLS